MNCIALVQTRRLKRNYGNAFFSFFFFFFEIIYIYYTSATTAIGKNRCFRYTSNEKTKPWTFKTSSDETHPVRNFLLIEEEFNLFWLINPWNKFKLINFHKSWFLTFRLSKTLLFRQITLLTINLNNMKILFGTNLTFTAFFFFVDQKCKIMSVQFPFKKEEHVSFILNCSQLIVGYAS